MSVEEPDPLEEWRREKGWQLTTKEQVYDRAFRTAWHAVANKDIAHEVATARAEGNPYPEGDGDMAKAVQAVKDLM